MKPQRALVAERPLAQHCAELLRAGPGADDLLPLLTAMGDRLSRRLEAALTPMLGGKEPLVRCNEPREGTLDGLKGSIAQLAANSLLAVGPAAAPLLVSIEAEPVLRIVDRAFGGKGEAPVPMPKSFPMAAELMVARLEGLLAAELASTSIAVQSDARTPPPIIVPVRRDGSLAMLAPFAADLALTVVSFEVDDGGVLPWLMTLAMPAATLAALFGVSDGTAPTISLPPPRRLPAAALRAAAQQAPFADIPVTVSAVVVDTKLPFATIAALKVGQVLPVSVARQVPLRIGEHTIASGAIGAVDERVAIQITKPARITADTGRQDQRNLAQ